MPRDSAGGNYTLPAGNPVVDGTVIESIWANNTLSDIALQLNNIFTRDGLLGPTAPVLFVNGTVALPGIAFAQQPSSGLYRVAPSTIGMSVVGVTKQTWDATGTIITGTANISGDVTLGGALNVTGTIGPITAASLGLTGDLTVGGISTFSGKLTTAASTTTPGAGFRLTPGVAPTTPVDGDVWLTASNLVARIGGSNRIMVMSSTAQTLSGAMTFTAAAAFNGGVTLGDAAGDALTINSNTASIPNHLNFTGGSIGMGMAPVNITTATTIDIANANQSWINLYVAGTRKAFFSATGNSTALGTHDAFPLYFLTGNVSRMIIAADGNVVVGTSGTTTNYGAGFLDFALNASTSSVFDLKVGDVRQASFSATVTQAVLGTNVNTPLLFITNGTEKARIAADGVITASNDIRLTDNRVYSWGDGTTYLAGSSTTDVITLFTNAVERMRISALGDVGVGMAPINFGAGVTNFAIGSTLNSLVDLTVGGVRMASFSAQATQTVLGTIANFPLAFWTNSLERMRIQADGKVLMGGTTASAHGLTVYWTTAGNGIAAVNTISDVSSSYLSQRADNVGASMTMRINVTVAGSITHPTLTTTAYNTSSDARLKHHVKPVKDVGRIIDGIPVVSFDWKTDGVHVPVGLIAQDVHGVFPGAVCVGGNDAKEEPWQMDNAKLVPLLIRELQCLRERVAALEE